MTPQSRNRPNPCSDTVSLVLMSQSPLKPTRRLAKPGRSANPRAAPIACEVELTRFQPNERSALDSMAEVHDGACRVGLTGFVDEFRAAGLPDPVSEAGYARNEVESLLSLRAVPVPRGTTFRLVANAVCGNDGRESLQHRRWSAHQFLMFEAACKLLAAGFTGSELRSALGSTADWNALVVEAQTRVKFLVSYSDHFGTLAPARTDT